MNVAQKLIHAHLVSGRMTPGEEIAIHVDQTLTQDATGTLVMLELEAMGIDRVRTELSVQYVDHNLLQEDFKNADDHLFLRSACARFGVWYSKPGNGVSHPLHQEYFGVPGKTLLGSDSHTPAAGSIGMLAIGAGGVDVALAMAGEPFHFVMPAVWGVRLTGQLTRGVSAKDVILELLRRHGTAGGVGRVIEYWGPGLASLTAMDRHVIANMGAELGATTSVFPSDESTRVFLAERGRLEDFAPLEADGSEYDVHEDLDLSRVEPLIAMPSSPGNVVPVREVAGQEIYQAYIGSSANPGFRDFAIAAAIIGHRRVHPRVSLDVNPTSRSLLEDLIHSGVLDALVHAGARVHQAGCNGCIGMGQAPATQKLSLRTVPRNFPGRSGTKEDKVCLVSPETAAASALTGVITDPRAFLRQGRVASHDDVTIDFDMFEPPRRTDSARRVSLVKGPNITSLPDLVPPGDELVLPVLLEVGDDVSTDEILPAGARVLPYRSNIAAISRFAFEPIDASYAERAHGRPHAIVAGHNYGQGSSREHAALAPAALGLRVVLARSFARIHMANLASFGVLPLVLEEGDVHRDDELRIHGVRAALASGHPLAIETARGRIHVRCDLSRRQREVILAGGIFHWIHSRAA